MSTVGTISRRTPLTGVNNPAYQVSKTVANDSLIVASAAANGSVMVRDSANPDGWGFLSQLPAASVDFAAGLTLGAGTLAAPLLVVGEAGTGFSLPAPAVLKIGIGGVQVARFSTTDNNLGLGVSALSGVSLTGTLNTAVGRQSLQSLTSGGTNTAVGASTGRQLTTQSGVTLMGYGAGDALVASASTMVGAEAGVLSTVANDLFGYRAGYRLTTGSGNQFFGASVGSNQLTGSENFAAGFDVMTFGTGGTAIYNTVIGSTAGKKLLSGISNTFIGRAAGQDAVAMNYGVFVGHSAGMHVLGDHNTAVGRRRAVRA